MRWMQFSRVSSQRIGSLFAVLAATGDGHPRSLDAVATRTGALLQRNVRVPDDRHQEVQAYLHRMRLWKRYRPLRVEDAGSLGDAKVQIQDIWLADEALASASGAITDEVLDEPGQLAVSLRLVRDKNHTPTDRGKALALAAKSSIEAIRQADTSQNGFTVARGSAVIAWYSLLDADFHFLQAAYRANEHLMDRDFTRMEFALSLDVACTSLRDEWIRRARTGADRMRLRRLDELAASIAGSRGGKTWGGGRTPDQLATARLEPLVDVGILTRLTRFDYRYGLRAAQRELLSGLLDSEANEYLNDGFAQPLFQVWNGDTQRVSDQDELWHRIVAAHALLRSRTGYASVVETCLLALAQLADEGAKHYFEMADGFDVIKAHQGQDPRRVRYGVARGGALSYLKIVPVREASNERG